MRAQEAEAAAAAAEAQRDALGQESEYSAAEEAVRVVRGRGWGRGKG